MATSTIKLKQSSGTQIRSKHTLFLMMMRLSAKHKLHVLAPGLYDWYFFNICQLPVSVYFILPLLSLHTSLNNSVDVSQASFLKLWQCTVEQIEEVAPFYDIYLNYESYFLYKIIQGSHIVISDQRGINVILLSGM